MTATPEIIAAELVLEFIKFLAPYVGEAVDLPSLAKRFWGDKGLGPMPPDMKAWDDLDAEIDKERAEKKASER